MRDAADTGHIIERKKRKEGVPNTSESPRVVFNLSLSSNRFLL